MRVAVAALLLTACTSSPHLLGEVPVGDLEPETGAASSGTTTAEVSTSTGTVEPETSDSSSTTSPPVDPTTGSTSSGTGGELPECVVDGEAEVCASLDADGSGARLTVTRRTDDGCLALAGITQVGTNLEYPDVDDPEDWDLVTIWATNDPTDCAPCSPTPARAIEAAAATGSWSWSDGTVAMAIEATFAAGTRVPDSAAIDAEGVQPELCF
ncbi:MAG: hypothetical protein AAF721_20300 [Myxococcota bacterium]